MTADCADKECEANSIAKLKPDAIRFFMSVSTRGNLRLVMCLTYITPKLLMRSFDSSGLLKSCQSRNFNENANVVNRITPY